MRLTTQTGRLRAVCRVLVLLLSGLAAAAQARDMRDVAAIGNRIVTAVGQVSPATRRWHWTVTVVQKPGVNAFCLPGGRMIVTTGLLRRIQPTDGQLAFVLAHETIHLLNGDPQTNIFLTQHFRLRAEAYLAHKRQQEYRADRGGMMLVARAGYDPRAAIAFLMRDQRALGINPDANDENEDHPSINHRIASLWKSMPRAWWVYTHHYHGPSAGIPISF